jgi:hypothetical protein
MMQLRTYQVTSSCCLYNNIVLSMLYAEICPKVRRHNARPEVVLSMLYAEICPKVRRHNARPEAF